MVAEKQGKRQGRRVVRVLILVGGALLGYHLGFRLFEENKNRARKVLTEAREMPFRLFV